MGLVASLKPRLTIFSTVRCQSICARILRLNVTLLTVQQVDEEIYLSIQIAEGHILLPILVQTVLVQIVLLSRKVARHPVFVNFRLSWIFSSVAYSLL